MAGRDAAVMDRAVVIDRDGLDALVRVLGDHGYLTYGPVVRDGAVMPGPVSGVDDLPVGCHDVQSPGQYRLEQRDDPEVFGWAVGPGSWKASFFPPHETLWSADAAGEPVREPQPPLGSMAIVGARPCEVAALHVLDRVLMDESVPDPGYAARRQNTFVVAAECGTPSSSCFCTSMGTGPGIESDFDLALTELSDSDGHRFVVRAGSERGSEILEHVPTALAGETDVAERERVLERARGRITRQLPAGDVAPLLARNLEHPRWDDVAARCLSCGNCTLVCPTCFCSDVRDATTLRGEVRRDRRWASCFDLDHSYLGGSHVRSSVSSRYRQWLTHKLSTWHDQFGTSGCVGCGRCISWCPVGIDITEEVAAISSSEGARGERSARKGKP
jgi:sulfhydrogenase subunit beta (sulfur reductase)